MCQWDRGACADRGKPLTFKLMLMLDKNSAETFISWMSSDIEMLNIMTKSVFKFHIHVNDWDMNFQSRLPNARLGQIVHKGSLVQNQCSVLGVRLGLYDFTRAVNHLLVTRATLCYRGSLREQRVRLSVRLSVTCQYCVKTKKPSIMISSPSILVFWCQILPRHSKASPRAGASNKGGVGKFSHFLASSINISKTVPDKAKVTIND